ncbi:type II toxin-antitoxin system RelE/ParE family toxin [Anaerovoracaceae bacterium 41-7]|uniref:type II toxin-antitoxin system RelE/ParE family toxin n=1 Tax=Senimuribacter intestinalis TaxID=2941507 RepID=UPI00203AD86C|nr:type II toxin-antitoxin system RelE/ParE family toxin [Senimuribacter intestinalis]
MTKKYIINYSQDALDDLRDLYVYISSKLLAPGTAAGQVGRIRKGIRSLDFMPTRYALVEWEPWRSMRIHQLPVDNFIVYYLVDDETESVTVVRIFYGGRDIEGIIRSIE